jgi:formylglycine-generating enzyme required for sulfatase activity
VEQVSWNDVQEFIRRLNQLEETDKYRLPTEAQWEYAARAGAETALYSGPLRILGSNNAPDLDAITWYKGNSCVDYAGGFDSSGWQDRQYSCPRSGTHPVGRKAPNAWGLYDMIGNVFEWVQDRMGEYPPGSLTDPEGPSSGSTRVRRGGSWGSSARYCRAAFRLKGGGPDARGDGMGFRLVRTR